MKCNENKEINGFLYEHYLMAKNSAAKMTLHKLAKATDLSTSYLSQIFAKKKNINIEVFVRIYNALNLPKEDQVQWLKYFFSDFTSLISLLQIQSLKNEIDSSVNPDSIKNVTLIPPRNFDILSEWYYLPLLQLMTLKDFVNNLHWMSEKLGISIQQVESSLKKLQISGLIKKDSKGDWQVDKKAKINVNRSIYAIRNYHQTMIKKSLLELEKTSDSDYQKRLITAFCFSTNSEKFQDFKIQLERLTEDLINNASDCEANQVHQLNIQIFPLVS